jgi:predicted transcriptional regulator
MKRTQIYLDEDQDRRLADRARAAGVTKSMLIRQAVTALLDAPSDDASRLAEFRAALDHVAASPATLPAGQTYVEDVRGGDQARERDIEKRRR